MTISVRVTWHENYVQTCVRMQIHPLRHIEHATGDVRAFYDLLKCKTEEDIIGLIDGFRDEPETPVFWKERRLDGFTGFMNINMLFIEERGTWEVEEARHIDKRFGGKSILNVFKSKLKDTILLNIAIATMEHNVSKLEDLAQNIRAL